MGSLYTASLSTLNVSDTVGVTVVAGPVTLYMSFRWCTENQEQWDAFEAYITRISKADPLYKKGEPFDKAYDYIDFYMQFADLSESDAMKLYKSLDYIPYSLTKYDPESDNFYLFVLQPRIKNVQDLIVYRNLFKECGVWQCIVMYEGNPRVARVVPGGWACNQDNDFRFRFTSEREVIRYDDLPYVTLEVYVNG